MWRFFSAILLLSGMGLAFGYPLLAGNRPSHPIATYPVYAPVVGFMRVEARLEQDNQPVEIYVDLASAGAPKFEADRAVLTLTVSALGKTVLAEPLTFAGATVRDDTPQTPELIYRTQAGTIAEVDPTEPLYTFVAGQGDAEGIDLGSVNVVLQQGTQPVDPRAQPIGFAVLGIGAVAFLLSFRGGGGNKAPPNPNSQPPPPRWGRLGGGRR